jgi:hypothetical protein
MSFERISEFQQGQRETVSKLGALLSQLNSLIETIEQSDETLLNEKIKRLQPVVGEFMTHASPIYQFLDRHHYLAYYRSIGPAVNSIATILANQTMPSKKTEREKFKKHYQSQVNELGEAMIAIAQLLPSNVDVNIKAKNPFSAFCFINSLMKISQSIVMIVDPYIDKTIFLRYISDLPCDCEIKIVADPDKLKGMRLAEYESIETIFSIQYPNYERKMVENLHDRYLVCDGVAYTLGGSIKDAASKSDYSIVQVSESKKNEILQSYA